MKSDRNVVSSEVCLDYRPETPGQRGAPLLLEFVRAGFDSNHLLSVLVGMSEGRSAVSVNGLMGSSWYGSSFSEIQGMADVFVEALKDLEAAGHVEQIRTDKGTMWRPVETEAGWHSDSHESEAARHLAAASQLLRDAGQIQDFRRVEASRGVLTGSLEMARQLPDGADAAVVRECLNVLQQAEADLAHPATTNPLAIAERALDSLQHRLRGLEASWTDRTEQRIAEAMTGGRDD